MSELAPSSLEEGSQRFAAEVEATLRGVLPGDPTMVSRRAEETDRFIVQPENRERIPLLVGGEHLADLRLSYFLDLDRTGTYLKVVRSDFEVGSKLENKPLVRFDYRADMNNEPIAHWQMHAERGAFSHLLARANVHRPRRVGKPHDLSSLHLPVGGERFRPCLEDVLQFLVLDCGVDHVEGWEDAVAVGREAWRRRQLRASVRDLPGEAAEMLKSLGWRCEPPADLPPDNTKPFVTW